jgi:hypothetical protein
LTVDAAGKYFLPSVHSAARAGVALAAGSNLLTYGELGLRQRP